MESLAIQQPLAKPKCMVCGKDAINRCGKCKSVWYCTTECQGKHWTTHKLVCTAEHRLLTLSAEVSKDLDFVGRMCAIASKTRHLEGYLYALVSGPSVYGFSYIPKRSIKQYRAPAPDRFVIMLDDGIDSVLREEREYTDNAIVQKYVESLGVCISKDFMEGRLLLQACGVGGWKKRKIAPRHVP